MKKPLSLIAVLVFVLTLAFASVALAHEGAHEEAGLPWLNIGLVAGGLIVVGAGAYFAVKQRS